MVAAVFSLCRAGGNGFSGAPIYSEPRSLKAAATRMKKKQKDKHLGEAFEEVFKGKKSPPSFYARVYEIVEQIPRGKVTTYGAIAEVLGMKRSSRMVGQALSALSKDSDIPAQRVINRIGALSAAHHFGGYERLRAMLRKEGVTFKGELVDMEKHFWRPGEREHSKY